MSASLIRFDFDRENIGSTGISLARLSEFADAVALLLSAALRSRLNFESQDMVPDPHLYAPCVFELGIAAEPVLGSIRVPIWVRLTAGVGLAAAANVSQVTGMSIKDGINAIRSMDDDHEKIDEASDAFSRSAVARKHVDDVAAKATATGCTYVAISYDNLEPAVIIGSGSGRMALLGSRAKLGQSHTVIDGYVFTANGDEAITVSYEGETYQAIAQSVEEGEKFIVLIWASTKPLPKNGDVYRVRGRNVSISETVRHVGEIPGSFKLASQIYFVTAASFDEFQ